MNKSFLTTCFIVIIAFIQGCAITPWVEPYERERLADDIMQLSRNPLSDKFDNHVYETREGARGAGLIQGGGCGCN